MIKQLAQQARRVHAAMAGSDSASRGFGQLARKQFRRLVAPAPTGRVDSILDHYLAFVVQLAASPSTLAAEYLDEVRQYSRAAPAAVGVELQRLIALAGATRSHGAGGGAAWRLFELFLAEYAPRVRRTRGVYFTPPELVSFMVRCARQLVGAAVDPAARLRCVDPACGTGAFLLEAARQFRGRSTAIDLAGFELLPAAAATAALELAPYCGAGRPIFCESALENDTSVRRAMQADALVVLGNPPYANFGRQNRHPWILGLLDDYKTGLGERKLNLDDDYIKFVRWSQYWLDRCGTGVAALVTNSRYLSGLIHRRMRQSLLDSFDRVYIVDLGGQADAQRDGQPAEPDENLFGIRQGVAVGLFVKTRSATARRPEVAYTRLAGTRDDKLAILASSDVERLSWSKSAPAAPRFVFIPRAPHAADYDGFPRLDEIFEQYVSGVQTKRDSLFVDRDSGRLESKIRQYLHATGSDIPFRRGCIRPYRVSPLDTQWVYYEPRLIGRARYRVLQHMLRPNLALVFMRQSTNAGAYDHFLATDCLASDRVLYSRCGAPFVAPLWIGERSNLRPEFLAALARAAGLGPWDPGQSPPGCVSPVDAFHYMYAVFHATRFRRDYAEQLKIDFPRLPLPGSSKQYRALRRLGKQLVRVHGSEGTEGMERRERREIAGDSGAVGFPVRGSGEVSRRYPQFEPRPADAGRVWINDRQYFDGISRSGWEFRIGGYPVLARWLARRRDSQLDPAEIAAFASIAGRVARTLRLIGQIDEVDDERRRPDAPRPTLRPASPSC